MEGERGRMKEIDDFVSSLRLGEPDSFGNLTVFPLYSEYSRVDGYTLLRGKLEGHFPHYF